MTLEQAIDRYTNNAKYERIHGSLHGCLEFRQLAEWLKDYKRLLEQQPTTTTNNNNEPITVIYPTIVCDDAISRQAVQDYIAKYLSQYLYNDVREAVEVIDEYMGELPSVNPQPKTGHWIKDDITERSKSAYKHKCDRCGAYHRAMYDYCPSCGAKMIEPQERSDKG